MKNLLAVLVCLVVFYNGRTFGDRLILLDDRYLLKIDLDSNTNKIGKIHHKNITTLQPCFEGSRSTCNKALQALPDLKWTTMSLFELEIYSSFAFYTYLSFGHIERQLNQTKYSWMNYTIKDNEIKSLKELSIVLAKPIEVNVTSKLTLPAFEVDPTFEIDTYIAKTPNGKKASSFLTVKVEAICADVWIFASIKPKMTYFWPSYSYRAKDNAPAWIRSPASENLTLTVIRKNANMNTPECDKPRYILSFYPPDENDVPNPCSMFDTNRETRFAYPDSTSKYIECKASGLMDIVTCPQKYTASKNGCGDQTLFNGTVLYTGVNPCTTQAIRNGIMNSTNPSDNTSYIECTGYGVAFSKFCPTNTYWSQSSYKCVNSSDKIFQTYIYILLFCLFIQMYT